MVPYLGIDAKAALSYRQAVVVRVAGCDHPLPRGQQPAQVSEEMYIQLHRSKIQFFHKFGGESRAWQGKALLTLAYAPRAAYATAAAMVHPAWRARACTYHRLLVGLRTV